MKEMCYYSYFIKEETELGVSGKVRNKSQIF